MLGRRAITLLLLGAACIHPVSLAGAADDCGEPLSGSGNARRSFE